MADRPELVTECIAVVKELKALRKENKQLKHNLELQQKNMEILRKTWEDRFFTCAPTEKVGQYVRDKHHDDIFEAKVF